MKAIRFMKAIKGDPLSRDDISGYLGIIKSIIGKGVADEPVFRKKAERTQNSSGDKG